MARKRSASDEDTKDFVREEDIDEEEDAAPKAKKQKADLGGTRDGDDTYWEISRNRRVTISKFGGKPVVSIREHYEKDGKTLPGKKGITLPMDQFAALMSVIDNVNQTLVESGDITPLSEPTAEKKVKKETKGKSKKSNFEATSDEEE